MAQGLEVWATPDIVTWDELIERMFMLDRQAARLGGRWLPASATQLLWERIVRDDPGLSPLLSPAGVARAAAQSWRRLHDFQVPFAALDDDQSAETAAFARWCREYRRLLEERDWTDGALAQSRVHALSAAPGLELAGFDRLTPLQESLLQKWAAAGLEVQLAKAPDVVGRCWRTQCLDPAAEIDAAARWAAERLDGERERRVAIVVPDLAQRRDEVRRIIERVVVPATGVSGGPAPESHAFELAAARPLAEQPVVAAALDLLDAFVRPPDLPALSRLLRNPFVAGAEEESAARARLDARLRRYESPGLGLTAFERMAAERGCPLLAGTLAAARAAMSVWLEKDSPSHCSQSIAGLLVALGWPGSSPDSTEHQAEQRWRMLVAELGACDEFTGRVTRAEAAGLLREMAGRVLFEPQELRAPLLVIDPETCAGMHFDALWICGLDAARWPPPTTPDPFLPRLAQLSQRVPRASAEIAAQDAQATLQRLLASAAEVMLSVAEIEDDAPLLPSPLLDGIAMLTEPAQWPESRLAEALYSGRPALETLVDAELPPINADEAQRGGARLLELQAACPFRAQAELRLGARALEEPGVGVDAAERGDLIHRALAVLWQELGDQQALKALDPSGVVVAVRRAVATRTRRGATLGRRTDAAPARPGGELARSACARDARG